MKTSQKNAQGYFWSFAPPFNKLIKESFTATGKIEKFQLDGKTPKVKSIKKQKKARAEIKQETHESQESIAHVDIKQEPTVWRNCDDHMTVILDSLASTNNNTMADSSYFQNDSAYVSSSESLYSPQSENYQINPIFENKRPVAYRFMDQSVYYQNYFNYDYIN